MIEPGHDYITPDQLRIGLYVELELGWMAHPFPKGSFKISSERQIETLRGLGLERIRFLPARSDPPPGPAAEPPPAAAPVPAKASTAAPAPPAESLSAQQELRRRQLDLLDAQRHSLAQCDRQFAAAIRRYEGVLQQLASEPAQAARICQDMVERIVVDIMDQSESSIRLLSEGEGDRASMHPVNVTVLCLLLGKALGQPPDVLQDLGVAAFLHDIGKTLLPGRVRWMDKHLSADDLRAYQDHVAHGIAMARGLGVSDAAQRALAEHHELMDGSGFPRRLHGEEISLPGRILALVNRYDNLCNPPLPASAVTPHEALSLIFAQMQPRFDAAALAAFIRMMGVYPPGSVVQLANDRFALVVSVNSARPLKPRVLVHDPAVAREEALILDLEQTGAPAIRRSLKPSALPKAAIDYLSPRTRICYFFERAVVLQPAPETA